MPRLSLAVDGLPTAETFAEPKSNARLSREELLESAGIDSDTLDAIEEFGLIVRRPSQTYYDGEALQVAALVGEFVELGIEPRHLRIFRTAAEREVALFEQVVTPRARQLDKEASEQTVSRPGRAVRTSAERSRQKPIARLARCVRSRSSGCGSRCRPTSRWSS